MNHPSLAYLLVALCYLLPKVEKCSRDLGLACPVPLTRTNLTSIYLLGGRWEGLITTTNYAFTFANDGGISGISRLNKPKVAIRDFQANLARLNSELDSEGAYQLATQWLATLNVNLAELSRRYTYRIVQPELDEAQIPREHGAKRRTSRLVPDFTMEWKEIHPSGQDARWPHIVSVEVLGPGRVLERLSIDDRTLVYPSAQHPAVQLGLLSLPDRYFTNLWAHPDLSVSNVLATLHTSTAYQSELLSRMMQEGNWSLEQVGIGDWGRFRSNTVCSSFVAPPSCGYQGCVATDSVLCQFDAAGKLTYLASLGNGHKEAPTYARGSAIGGSVSALNSNSVTLLARSLALKLELDINLLDRLAISKASCSQRDQSMESAFWWVIWRDVANRQRILLSMVIDAKTQLPSRIKIDEPTLSKRKGISIPNPVALMFIPDHWHQQDPLMPHLNVFAAPLALTR